MELDEGTMNAKPVRPLSERAKAQAVSASQAIREEFGKQLRAARIEAGLSQFALGKMTGLGQAHVSEIELGRVNVTLDTLLLLARATGLTVRVIFEPPAA